eukprot:scaffold148502_cov39-Cyclotella_meneghiniana.AAC.1
MDERGSRINRLFQPQIQTLSHQQTADAISCILMAFCVQCLPKTTIKDGYIFGYIYPNLGQIDVIIVPAGHVYSSGGVCEGAQGGRGGKWGALLVAGIQTSVIPKIQIARYSQKC